METDLATKNFLNAASVLLESAVGEAMATDRAAADGLNTLLRGGGMLAIRATFAPTTGLACLTIEISEPSGESHVLMARELQRAALQ